MRIDFTTKKRSIDRRGGCRSGFTLIEILAATSIMVLVTIFVLALSSQVMTMWSRSSNTLATNYEGRAALDKLAQDVESSVLRRNEKEWFVIRTDSTSGDLVGQPHLMFYAAIPDRPGERTGDVCAISYRIAYKSIFGSSDATKKRFGLYRAIVDARTTFEEALATDSPEEYWINNPGGAAPGGDSLEGTIVEGTVTTRDDWSYAIQNLLSMDVAVLRIDVTYEMPDGSIGTVTEVSELAIGDTVYIRSGVSEITDASRILYFDIRLGVLGEEGARAFHFDTSLSGSPSVYSSQRVEDAMNRYGQWYTRRVTLRSTPI